MLEWLRVDVIFSREAQSRRHETRLDILNYGCSGNLLCDHGVVERNRISSLQSHGEAFENECFSRVSSVIVVICLSISCASSMAISCHVPVVSMVNG